MSHGYQFQASYTLAKGEDNAPLDRSTYIVAGLRRPPLGSVEPGPRQGRHASSTRPTPSCSARSSSPASRADGFWAALANNNQLGVIVQANSGLPFNIRSNQDLNQDGVLNDRPLDIERNSGRLGSVVNVDARYVRFINLSGRVRAELFAEAKNLFNRGCSDPSTYATCDANVLAVNRIVTTDAAGNPAAALPEPVPGHARATCSGPSSSG